MIGAGTVINPIIKIVTTVAILAAVGIFIVKPVLETTEKAVEGAITLSEEKDCSVSATFKEHTEIETRYELLPGPDDVEFENE